MASIVAVQPLLVEPAQGEVITQADERDVRILVGGLDQLTVTHSGYAAGDGGPPDPALVARIASRYDFEPVA